jgi:hypothetical protein
MKNVFTKKRVSKGLVTLGLIFGMAACYMITDVRQPATVAPGATYQAVIKVQNDDSDTDASSSYGMLGVLLPDGWSIDAEQAVIEKYEGGSTTPSFSTGVQTSSADYITVLETRFGTTTGYSWWGGQSIDELDIDWDAIDSLVAHIPVVAGTESGDYSLQYVIGDWNGTDGMNAEWVDGTSNDKLTYSSTMDGDGVTHLYSGIQPVTVDVSSGMRHVVDEKAFTVSTSSEGNLVVDLLNADLIGDTKVRIYDISGQLVGEKVLTGSSQEINLNGAKTGVYLVKLIHGDKIGNAKFVLR